MKFEELKKNLRQNIEPCYIINGGESFLTTNALKIIEETLNITLPDYFLVDNALADFQKLINI